MQIAITTETEKAIEAAVAAGGYDDAEHYINEALRYYYQLKIDKLDAALATGFEQLERGEGIPYGRKRIDKKIEQRMGIPQ